MEQSPLSQIDERKRHQSRNDFQDASGNVRDDPYAPVRRSFLFKRMEPRASSSDPEEAQYSEEKCPTTCSVGSPSCVEVV